MCIKLRWNYFQIIQTLYNPNSMKTIYPVLRVRGYIIFENVQKYAHVEFDASNIVYLVYHYVASLLHLTKLCKTVATEEKQIKENTWWNMSELFGFIGNRSVTSLDMKKRPGEVI